MSAPSVREPQRWAVQLYFAIEDWWGEPLSRDLAEKAFTAPAYQLAAFAEQLAGDEILDDIPRPSKMAPGILRPLVGANLIDRKGWSRAAS